MTYRQYLENCTDEFEKIIVIMNLARRYPHPNYDSYSTRRKREVLKGLLDFEMPQAESEEICQN